MQNHPSTVVCTAEGIFIWPGISVRSHGQRRSDQEICNLLSCLHGPEVVQSEIVPVIQRAADLLQFGHLEKAQRCLGGLRPLQLSPSGRILMREISSRLGVAAPFLQVRDCGGIAPLSPALAQKIAAGFDGACEKARRLQRIFCAGLPGSVHKDGWDADKHPRVGEGPNPGWFAPVEHLPSGDPLGENTQDLDASAVTPVADFSGGFHDVVVDAWITALNAAGTPAIKAPAIRMIGSGAVVGFPDIIAKPPGLPAEVLEVKTGKFPTLTLNQAFYIPMLQLGGHIYSTDPRVTQVGLTPGVPFAPMIVIIIYAPAPGQPYGAEKLPGPKFSKLVFR